MGAGDVGGVVVVGGGGELSGRCRDTQADSQSGSGRERERENERERERERVWREGRGDRRRDWNSGTTRPGLRHVASSLASATPIDPGLNSACSAPPPSPPPPRPPSLQLIAASPWKRNKVSRSGR